MAILFTRSILVTGAATRNVLVELVPPNGSLLHINRSGLRAVDAG